MKERKFIRAWYNEKNGRLSALSDKTGVSKSSLSSKKSKLSESMWNTILSSIIDITIEESDGVKTNKHEPYKVDNRIFEIEKYLQLNPNLLMNFTTEIKVSNFVEKVKRGLIKFTDNHYDSFVQFKNDYVLAEAYNLMQIDKKEKLIAMDNIYCELYDAKKSSNIWSSQIYKLIFSTKGQAMCNNKRSKLSRVVEQFKASVS